jgi:hypothetical protein
MTWVFGALVAALVVIYMARPNFRRAVLSAALFFHDDPVLGSTSRIAWSTPHPTPLFYLQVSVLLLLLLAIPHCPASAVMDRSTKTGVRVLVDRSASMSTQQDGGTRFDAAIAAIRAIVAPRQSAIACFTLSTFDLELSTVADNVATVGQLIDLVSGLQPRPLGTDLSLVERTLAGAPATSPGVCATGTTIVFSDMPAPPWMDRAASRGDVWIDVSKPATNAGIVDLVDTRDRVSGQVQRVRVVVGRFEDAPATNVTLNVRLPDGSAHTYPVGAWDGTTGSVEVIPSLPGLYTFQVTPGGAYRYDDEAAIDVPRSGPVRVDWRVARREWMTRLGWIEDRENPDLRVLPSVEMLDSRPAIVLGSGYAPRTDLVQPVTTFVETSPLVAGLNLDVAERSGIRGAASLPAGFTAVLSGPEGVTWIAERATPVAAFVPGLPLERNDNVARFSSTVFLNAARWILERRPRAPLFTLTSPEQIEPSGSRVALHPGEGNTRRQARSVGRFDPSLPREHQTERRRALWPWLVAAAALVFVTERSLALTRGML